MIRSTEWNAFLAAHGDGSVLSATVTRVAPFGALLAAAPGIHGLLPHTEWATEPENGATVPVRIAEIDVARRRMRFAAA